jgi:hypothetical protein
MLRRVTDATIDVLIVVADEADAETLRATADARVFERKNLGGDAAAWLVFASLLAPQVPAVLTFVRGLADRNRVSSIKVGDVEIVNPTPDQVERLLAGHRPGTPGG